MIKNYKTIKLETSRLILDKGTIEDFVSVFEYNFSKLRDVNNEFVFEKLDPNYIRSWFKDGEINYYLENEKNHVFDWIIYLKDNTPIGNITADRENFEINSIEVSYNLHPNYWGNGYMGEAVKVVIDYLFSVGYDNVICGYDEGNIKSKRICEKLNFKLYNVKKNAWQKDGKPIDTYYMIMEKDRWKELKKI